MILKYEFLNKILKRAIYQSRDEDTYTTLLKFEEMLAEHLRFNKNLPAEQKLEAHRVLAGINQMQVEVLEQEMQQDINGDGVIGLTQVASLILRKNA